MTDRELLQQALEALEANLGNWAAKTNAITALRERLEQPRQWQGLSTEEIYDMYNHPRSDAEMVEFARAVEAKIKEKNGG